MNEIISLIKQKAAAYKDEVIALRRHLHQHPELSFNEYNTSEFICQKLTEYKVEFQKGIVKTGIVALIKGKNPDKKVIALRGDIDALPIQEENEVAYCSKNAGIMHACGHDVHTASLLGVIKILSELTDKFEGTIKCIFQPGEEKLPGGASLMIKEGVLKNPSPTAIFGQHVYPQLTAGKVGFRKGMYMASTDELYLTVIGKGGHAALPHLNIDPIMIAAQTLVALQQVVSRGANPITPSVLSFGKIQANGATNVIPDKVYIEGTFRTMDEEWRKAAHEKITAIAEQTAIAMGGKCEVEIRKGYPFLVNDEELTTKAQKAAELFLGKENVVDLDVRMTAEDFAYYSQEMPACFYRLGTAFKDKPNSGLHTPTFNIDEAAIETSIGLMSWLAINELAS